MMWDNITFFQSLGKTLSFTKNWRIRLNGGAMDLPQCLIIRIDMLFHPCALSTFRFSSSVKVIFSILLLVLNSKVGSWLLLITGVH